ncbi:LLM class F420-dependent oxidoreductase [soil metagenome]
MRTTVERGPSYMDVAIMIEGQDGLDWTRWKRLASAAEDLGFAGLYRSDHFTNPEGPHKDAIELWVSLVYLAVNTSRIEFGPMVSPVSFRNPVVSAWAAAAVDDLSGGRFHMGLGAGWQQREHESHGFDLLEVGPRFDRFREGIQVVSTLLRSDTPSTFDGAFFSLKDALLLPRPKRPGGPPIVIGGNGLKRTLPLAAKYADEWNAVFATPERFAELSTHLDGLVKQHGRDPGAVKRTMMQRVTIGRTQRELDSKLEALDVENLKLRGAVLGTPNEVAERLASFAEAGVSRVMAQWIQMDDIDGLEVFADKVLPQLS